MPPDSVKIEGAPVIEVSVNTSYNLTCFANNGKPAPTITWQSNFQHILETAESVNVTLADGKRQDVTSYLTIKPQKSDQGRSYECHAVNDAMLQRMWTKIQLEVICKYSLPLFFNTCRVRSKPLFSPAFLPSCL